jgi:hypothetical protein
MKADHSRQMVEVLLCCIEESVSDSRLLEQLTDLCREHGWTPGKGSLYSWLEQGFTRGVDHPVLEELQEEEPPFATAPEPNLEAVSTEETITAEELDAELDDPDSRAYKGDDNDS